MYRPAVHLRDEAALQATLSLPLVTSATVSNRRCSGNRTQARGEGGQGLAHLGSLAFEAQYSSDPYHTWGKTALSPRVGLACFSEGTV